MKFITICLMIIGSLLANKAVAVYMDSAYIYTTFHSADSTHLFLVAKVIVGERPCSIESLSLMGNEDTTLINICYVGGTVTASCERIDTIDLGIKKNGPVNIIAIFLENVTDQCERSGFFQDTFNFFINTDYTAVSNLDVSDNSLTIYPNPVIDKLSCFINEPSSTTTLQIFSISGVPIRPLVHTTQSNTYLDVSDLPPGIYIVALQSDCQSKFCELIKN